MAVRQTALNSGTLSNFELALVREINLYAQSAASRRSLRRFLRSLLFLKDGPVGLTEVIAEDEIILDPKILWRGRPVAQTLVVHVGRMMQSDQEKAQEIVEQAERVGAILECVHRS